ncbi:NETI motif-containing protein [Salibacterium aidingense]|uniref:NETI motif-containing protein n=1 Tax=Salibacterium aidingense TaxID=384933 RepID=UPI0004283029|nr:NETI motif-containing protein [Salibacterium aidingense]
MAKKKRFEVEEGETIADCLARMKAEGYIPVRRMEKPVFQEVKQNGKTERIPVKQQIIFEANPQ